MLEKSIGAPLTLVVVGLVVVLLGAFLAGLGVGGLLCRAPTLPSAGEPQPAKISPLGSIVEVIWRVGVGVGITVLAWLS